MSKRVKWSILGAAVAGVAIFLVVTAAKSGKKGVEVRMEKVQRRDLVASVTASGQVRPRTKVDVSADVSGRIVRLAVKEGQMVSKGQFLLQIDPAQAEANVQRAEASLAAARASLLEAYGRWRRGLEDLENLWALAAWRSATAEEPSEQASALAA